MDSFFGALLQTFAALSLFMSYLAMMIKFKNLPPHLKEFAKRMQAENPKYLKMSLETYLVTPILLMIGIVINIYSFIVYIRNRCAWKLHHYYLFILTIANSLIMSFLVLMMYNDYLFRSAQKPFINFELMSCELNIGFLDNLLPFTCSLTLILMVDRIWAITRPFSYATIRKKRAFMLVLFVAFLHASLAFARLTQAHLDRLLPRNSSRYVNCDVPIYGKGFFFFYTFGYELPFLTGLAYMPFLFIGNLIIFVRVRRILHESRKLTLAKQKKTKHIKSAVITAIFLMMGVLTKIPMAVTFVVALYLNPYKKYRVLENLYLEYTWNRYFYHFFALNFFFTVAYAFLCLSDAKFVDFAFCRKVAKRVRASAIKRN